MGDLIEFLTARLDEDEAIANLAARGGDDRDEPEWTRWEWDAYRSCVWTVSTDRSLVASWPDDGSMQDADGEHIARHDPERVLVEVAAKRATIRHCAHLLPYFNRAEWTLANRTLRHLAVVYSDHPDYQQAWGDSNG